jgi:pyrimidine operon attenuation protein/uracil phosphoribosyltransferase
MWACFLAHRQKAGFDMGNHRQILDGREIDRILKEMASEIKEVHRNTRNVALIGIHTRGVFLARRLQKLISALGGGELAMGEIDITLYRDDWTQMSAQPVVKTTDIAFSVDNKQIILVDDVLYTGRTVRAAMDAVIDFGRPSRIELAVLVDRGHRELPIQSNYTGHCIKTERSEMVNVLLQECDGQDGVTLTESKGEPTI